VTVKEDNRERGKRLKISKILNDHWSIILRAKFTLNLYIKYNKCDFITKKIKSVINY